MPSPLLSFIRGLQAELPLLIGVAPFGMIYGVLALDSGLTRLQSQAMSAVVFAGSAQIVTTQLVQLGAPGLVMVLTIGIVNLRHLLYSASMAPYLQKLKPTWKWVLSYLLTDEAYVVSAIYYQNTNLEMMSQMSDQEEGAKTEVEMPDNRHWYFLGAGLGLWICWQVSTAAGILLGTVVPQSWSLDFTLALTFIALVVPNLKDRADLTAAITAGTMAIVVFSMPYKLGLLFAALVGIACGMLVESRN
jgi:predicted branched-subunit amino acid permease